MAAAAGIRDSYIISKINILRSNLAAAGFAVDRLEGDSIQTEHACIQPGEALAVFARLQ